MQPSRSCPGLSTSVSGYSLGLFRQPSVPRTRDTLQKIEAIRSRPNSTLTYNYAPPPPAWPSKRSVATPLASAHAQFSPPPTDLRMRSFQPALSAAPGFVGGLLRRERDLAMELVRRQADSSLPESPHWSPPSRPGRQPFTPVGGSALYMTEARRLFHSSNGSLPSTYVPHVHGRPGHEDRNPFGEDDVRPSLATQPPRSHPFASADT